jgi:hypothetical protein
LRLYLCDNHLPDFNEISFADFSVSEWERILIEGHVDTLMLYGKDHWGWSYYDTKVGKRHPKLGFDLFSETAKMLRRNNIKLMTYYSIGFDNLMSTIHEDWAVRSSDGQKYRIWREKYPKWHSCCFNTGYSEYCKAQIEELLKLQRSDFLFLDIIKHGGYTGFGQDNLPLCYCENCRAKFHQRYGIEMPLDKNQPPQNRRLIQDWEMNVMDYEMIDEITSFAEHIQPGLPVMFNETVHFAQRTRSRLNAHFSEGRYGTWQTAAMSRVIQKPRNYSRSVISCHPTISAFDPSCVAESAYAAAQAAAWDADPFLMHGPQDAHGKVEPMSVKQIGEAFGIFNGLEKVLEHREPIGEVWILESDRQRLLDPADHSKQVVALIDFLSYSKYSFSVVRENDLSLLNASDVRVLIAARTTWLSDNEAEAIRKFVERGGILVCSEDFSLGRCNAENDPMREPEIASDFLLQDVMGVSLNAIDSTFIDNLWGSYMLCLDHQLWQDSEISTTTVPLLPPIYDVKPARNAQVIAKHLLPCIPMAMNRWINWFSPPPGKKLHASPAVVLNSFGKGKCLYFSAPYLDTRPGFCDQKAIAWPKKWFTKMLKTLFPNPQIRLETGHPEFIDATYYRKADELIVHYLNSSAKEPDGRGILISAGQLILRKPIQKAIRARILPNERELKIHCDNEMQVIDLPEFTIHMLVSVELEK